MQESDSELRAFMKAKGLNQAKMAKKARVSQASVSRALKGDARTRRGRAYIRLFNCIHQESIRKSGVPLDKVQVLEAFERVWDASQAHAAAVTKVIQALDGLRPSGAKEE